MKRFAVILSLIFILISCSGNREEAEHVVNAPVLSSSSLTLSVGETGSVDILNLNRGSVSSISVSGEKNIVETNVSDRKIFVTAVSHGETTLTVKIGSYPNLSLKVTVVSPGESESVFNDATPRFEGLGIRIDCSDPGVLAYRIQSPQQWRIYNLNDHTSVTLTDSELDVNEHKYEVAALEIITDKSASADYIKISLKNNQEAWLVFRKEE